MKKLFYVLLIIGLFACDESTEGPECPDNTSCLPTEEMMQNDLDSAKAIILNLIQSSTCDSTGMCTFMGLGSKPCGGPWEYLIYSTSIDTLQLKNLVTNYNQMESTFNEVYGRGSDCAIAIAPDSVVCENNNCVAYHDGTAFPDGLCCN